MSDDELSFSVDQVAFTEASLELTYSVTNGGSERAFLVNRLFNRTPDGFRVDSDLVYADVAEGVLRLRKHMVEVPDEIDVEAPEVPYVTLVLSGGTFVETVRVPLPVRLKNPYLTQAATSASAIELHLGVVSSPEAEPALVGDELRLSYRTVAREQRVLVSPVVELGRTVETAAV